MKTTCGAFYEGEIPCNEYLSLVFSPSSLPLKRRWRNNDLSADFLADYFSTFFPWSEDDPATGQRRAEVKSAISFIANELLENALKYSDEAATAPISLQLQLHDDSIVFISSNGVTAEQAERYADSVRELLESDPSDLYIQRLEAAGPDEDVSGLGFLTMLNDYAAELGWQFEIPDEGSSGRATCTVKILL
jgi:hypothetical protein